MKLYKIDLNAWCVGTNSSYLIKTYLDEDEVQQRLYEENIEHCEMYGGITSYISECCEDTSDFSNEDWSEACDEYEEEYLAVAGSECSAILLCEDDLVDDLDIEEW